MILDVALPMLLTNLVYWGVGLGCLALDTLPWSRWRGIKCQPRAAPLPWRDIRHICLVVGAQLLTLYPLAVWLAAPLMRARLSFAPELPHASDAALSFAGFALFSELYFYHVHYLLHHPRLYPYCHKRHHLYTAPVALECLYFHPIESLLQLGTVVCGPLVLGSHAALHYVWIVVTLFNVALHHCGHEVASTPTRPHASCQGHLTRRGEYARRLPLAGAARRGARPGLDGAPARLPPQGLQLQLRRPRPLRLALRHPRRV